MIGCSKDGDKEHNIYLNDEDTGLFSGHAYAILDIIELKDEKCKNSHKSHRLI